MFRHLVSFPSLLLRLYSLTFYLGEVQAECQLPIIPEEYAAEKLKFGLMEVVYEWAKVHICFFCNLPVFLPILFLLKSMTSGNTFCKNM